jgi:hypothetical protein
MRLRDRIGNYFKYVDHAMIHNPDPKSAHYMNGNRFSMTFYTDQERYTRDYAAHDKMQREQQYRARQQLIEQKRYAGNSFYDISL